MGLFGWDYPPGVTGNEYEISGEDYSKEIEGTCSKCQSKNTLVEQGYKYQRWVVCGRCDYQYDLPDFEENPDLEKDN